MSTSYIALSLLRSSDETNTLPEDEPIVQPSLLQVYEEIFVKVKNWGSFEESDLGRNEIWSAQEGVVIPDFVQIFERKLVRKPRLDANVRCFFDLSLCNPSLTGQCRRLLYRGCFASLDHILELPRTR